MPPYYSNGSGPQVPGSLYRWTDTGTIAAANGAHLAPLATRRDIFEPKANSDGGFGTPNNDPRWVRTRDAKVKVDVDPRTAMSPFRLGF
jgi:hypothetical protein